MIDLSSLAPTMTNPVMTEAGPSKLSGFAGGAQIGKGANVGNAGSGAMVGSGAILSTESATTLPPGTQQLSTDGFMQVLDLFLGGSPLSSTLMATTSTAITQSPVSGSTSTTAVSSLDAAALLSIESVETSEPFPVLDEATAERIASILQMMGFQVKPSEIQELSELDLEQLGTALEFVERNLQKGANPAAIVENATLLLPRDWPLDDADGSPVAISDTTGATESNTSLPAGFTELLSDARTKINASLGQSTSTTNDESTGTGANPSAIGDAKTYPSDQSGDAKDQQSSLAGQDGKADLAPSTAKKPAHQDLSLQWNHQLQQANIGTPAEGTPATSIPRHLEPGGTTSELIGRQVLEKVHVQLNEGHREVRLRLWPEELGEVRLSLKMTDGEKVHANMVVENDAVRQAMLDATPQLKEALARHGLDLERLSVSVSQKDAHEAGSNANQNEKDHRQTGRGGRGDGGWTEAQVGIEEEIVLGEDTGRRNGRNTIDLWS